MTVDGIEIPSGFSPNNDDVNDTYVIAGIETFDKKSIKIFNRWGTTIYESDDYQNDWDGTCNVGLRLGGSELPVGTYFYIFEYQESSSDDVKIQKGYIYLNR